MIRFTQERTRDCENIHASADDGSVGVNIREHAYTGYASDTSVVMVDTQKVEVRLIQDEDSNPVVIIRAVNINDNVAAMVLSGDDILSKLRNEVCFTELDALIEQDV